MAISFDNAFGPHAAALSLRSQRAGVLAALPVFWSSGGAFGNPDYVAAFLVGTLVFCSIPQPALALAEIQRVLRPAGQLRLLEHVRGQRIPTRQLTDWLSPLWLRLTQDCHLNRETAQAVVKAGFRIDHSDIHLWGLFQQIRATSPKR